MPFNVKDLVQATNSLKEFRARAVSPHHERFAFPFFCGTYFAYRKVDVLRVAAVAKSVLTEPTLLDVGCGYGDFLARLREFLPTAEGLEADSAIFYAMGRTKPDYIHTGDANFLRKAFDCIFVGWMEPGQDFRDSVAANTDIIVTTLDQGISLAAEFDGHGFERVASWRTPSWEDVNIEVMNRHYSAGISNLQGEKLAQMRGAHNLWHVYCRPWLSGYVGGALSDAIRNEGSVRGYDFEEVLDECGFGYMEKLNSCNDRLWEVTFHSEGLKCVENSFSHR